MKLPLPKANTKKPRTTLGFFITSLDTLLDVFNHLDPWAHITRPKDTIPHTSGCTPQKKAVPGSRQTLYEPRNESPGLRFTSTLCIYSRQPAFFGLDVRFYFFCFVIVFLLFKSVEFCQDYEEGQEPVLVEA